MLPVASQVAVDVYRKQREEHSIGDRVIAELTAAKAAREAERREEAAILQRQQEVSQHQEVGGAAGLAAGLVVGSMDEGIGISFACFFGGESPGPAFGGGGPRPGLALLVVWPREEMCSAGD